METCGSIEANVQMEDVNQYKQHDKKWNLRDTYLILDSLQFEKFWQDFLKHEKFSKMETEGSLEDGINIEHVPNCMMKSWLWNNKLDVSTFENCMDAYLLMQHQLIDKSCHNTPSFNYVDHQLSLLERCLIAKNNHNQNVKCYNNSDCYNDSGIFSKTIPPIGLQPKESTVQDNITHIASHTIISLVFAFLKKLWRSGEDIELCKDLLMEVLNILRSLPEAGLFDGKNISSVWINVFDRTSSFLKGIIVNDLNVSSFSSTTFHVPSEDKHLALLLFVELSIHRATLSSVLEVVSFLLQLSQKKGSDDFQLKTSQLIPVLKRFRRFYCKDKSSKAFHKTIEGFLDHENLLTFLKLPFEENDASDNDMIDVKDAAVLICCYLQSMASSCLRVIKDIKSSHGNIQNLLIFNCSNLVDEDYQMKQIIYAHLVEKKIKQICNAKGRLFILTQCGKICVVSFLKKTSKTIFDFHWLKCKKKISLIASHLKAFYLLAVSTDGTVYKWGHFGEEEEERFTTIQLLPIMGLENETIIQIYCGVLNGIFVTDTGKMYMNRTFENIYIPSFVMTPGIVEFVDCDEEQIYVCCDGCVYFSNVESENERFVVDWKICNPLVHIEVGKICIGNSGLMAVISKAGQLFLWKFLLKITLDGHSSHTNNSVLEIFFGEEVIDISFGIHNVLVLFQGGDIYRLNKEQFVNEPEFFESFDDLCHHVIYAYPRNVSKQKCLDSRFIMNQGFMKFNGISSGYFDVAWATNKEMSLDAKMPYAIDLSIETFRHLEYLLSLVCDSVDGHQDWPPSQNEQFLALSILDLTNLQFSCLTLQANEKKLSELMNSNDYNKLLTNLKLKCVMLASNNGVLKSIQASAQSLLKNGLMIVMPTVEERARTLLSLLHSGKLISLSPGEEFMVDTLVRSLLDEDILRDNLGKIFTDDLRDEVQKTSTMTLSEQMSAKFKNDLINMSISHESTTSVLFSSSQLNNNHHQYHSTKQQIFHPQQKPKIKETNLIDSFSILTLIEKLLSHELGKFVKLFKSFLFSSTPSSSSKVNVNLKLILKFQHLLFFKLLTDIKCPSQLSLDEEPEIINASKQLKKYLLVICTYFTKFLKKMGKLTIDHAVYNLISNSLHNQSIGIVLQDLLLNLLWLQKKKPILNHAAEVDALMMPLLLEMNNFNRLAATLKYKQNVDIGKDFTYIKYNVGEDSEMHDLDELMWPGKWDFKSNDSLVQSHKLHDHDLMNYEKEGSRLILINGNVYDADKISELSNVKEGSQIFDKHVLDESFHKVAHKSVKTIENMNNWLIGCIDKTKMNNECSNETCFSLPKHATPSSIHKKQEKPLHVEPPTSLMHSQRMLSLLLGMIARSMLMYGHKCNNEVKYSKWLKSPLLSKWKYRSKPGYEKVVHCELSSNTKSNMKNNKCEESTLFAAYKQLSIKKLRDLLLQDKQHHTPYGDIIFLQSYSFNLGNSPQGQKLAEIIKSHCSQLLSIDLPDNHPLEIVSRLFLSVLIYHLNFMKETKQMVSIVANKESLKLSKSFIDLVKITCHIKKHFVKLHQETNFTYDQLCKVPIDRLSYLLKSTWPAGSYHQSDSEKCLLVWLNKSSSRWKEAFNKIVNKLRMEKNSKFYSILHDKKSDNSINMSNMSFGDSSEKTQKMFLDAKLSMKDDHKWNNKLGLITFPNMKKMNSFNQEIIKAIIDFTLSDENIDLQSFNQAISNQTRRVTNRQNALKTMLSLLKIDGLLASSLYNALLGWHGNPHHPDQNNVAASCLGLLSEVEQTDLFDRLILQLLYKDYTELLVKLLRNIVLSIENDVINAKISQVFKQNEGVNKVPHENSNGKKTDYIDETSKYFTKESKNNFANCKNKSFLPNKNEYSIKDGFQIDSWEVALKNPLSRFVPLLLTCLSVHHDPSSFNNIINHGLLSIIKTSCRIFGIHDSILTPATTNSSINTASSKDMDILQNMSTLKYMNIILNGFPREKTIKLDNPQKIMTLKVGSKVIRKKWNAFEELEVEEPGCMNVGTVVKEVGEDGWIGVQWHPGCITMYHLDYNCPHNLQIAGPETLHEKLNLDKESSNNKSYTCGDKDDTLLKKQFSKLFSNLSNSLCINAAILAGLHEYNNNATIFKNTTNKKLYKKNVDSGCVGKDNSDHQHNDIYEVSSHMTTWHVEQDTIRKIVIHLKKIIGSAAIEDYAFVRMISMNGLIARQMADDQVVDHLIDRIEIINYKNHVSYAEKLQILLLLEIILPHYHHMDDGKKYQLSRCRQSLQSIVDRLVGIIGTLVTRCPFDQSLNNNDLHIHLNSKHTSSPILLSTSHTSMIVEQIRYLLHQLLGLAAWKDAIIRSIQSHLCTLPNLLFETSPGNMQDQVVNKNLTLLMGVLALLSGVDEKRLRLCGRVSHDKFGLGTVVQLQLNGMVRVLFDERNEHYICKFTQLNVVATCMNDLMNESICDSNALINWSNLLNSVCFCSSLEASKEIKSYKSIYHERRTLCNLLLKYFVLTSSKIFFNNQSLFRKILKLNNSKIVLKTTLSTQQSDGQHRNIHKIVEQHQNKSFETDPPAHKQTPYQSTIPQQLDQENFDLICLNSGTSSSNFQQLLVLATQPSPLKPEYSLEDIEQALMCLSQSLMSVSSEATHSSLQTNTTKSSVNLAKTMINEYNRNLSSYHQKRNNYEEFLQEELLGSLVSTSSDRNKITCNVTTTTMTSADVALRSLACLFPSLRTRLGSKDTESAVHEDEDADNNEGAVGGCSPSSNSSVHPPPQMIQQLTDMGFKNDEVFKAIKQLGFTDFSTNSNSSTLESIITCILEYREDEDESSNNIDDDDADDGVDDDCQAGCISLDENQNMMSTQEEDNINKNDDCVIDDNIEFNNEDGIDNVCDNGKVNENSKLDFDKTKYKLCGDIDGFSDDDINVNEKDDNFASIHEQPFKSQKDFLNEDEYEDYVRQNLRRHMFVCCCRQFEDIQTGDIGVVIQLNSDEVSEVSRNKSLINWLERDRSYWTPHANLNLNGHTQKFKLGETVHVKPSVSVPFYSWGLVDHQSVGIVSEICVDGLEVSVNFPQQSRWNCLVHELEPSTLPLKTMICVDCSCTLTTHKSFRCFVCNTEFLYCDACYMHDFFETTTYHIPCKHVYHQPPQVASSPSSSLTHYNSMPLLDAYQDITSDQRKNKFALSKLYDSLMDDEGTIITEWKRCVVDCTVSSRVQDAHHLYDGSNSYWESYGRIGKHWIRLELHDRILVDRLVMKVHSNDTNYIPSELVIMAGQETSQCCQELNRVHVVKFDKDIVLLENMTEYYKFIEIQIKKCRNDGIDCKVRGLEIRGKLMGSNNPRECIQHDHSSYLASDNIPTNNIVDHCDDSDDDPILRMINNSRKQSISVGGTRDNKQQTNVFVWGLNDKDQLGGPRGSKIKVPVLNEVLSSLNCFQIAGGSKSLFCVTRDGKLYASGEATNGRLGLGLNGGHVSVPRQLTSLMQYVIKKVAVHSGGKHAMALTVDGKVFSWGDGDDGKLGHFSRLNCDKPKLIEALRCRRVRDIACGSSHSAAIISNGDLYTWGLGEYGRLGHGDSLTQIRPKQGQLWGVAKKNKKCVQLCRLTLLLYTGLGLSLLSPIPLQKVSALAGQRIVQVSLGSRDAQTLALTDEGIVYSWGDGDFGKLGRGGSDGCDVPQPVDRLRELGVCQIECGAQFSLALTKSGQVWTWGKGDYYRLGHGVDNHVRKPQLVEGLKDKIVVHVAVGALHCLAVTNKGQVYSWGDNDHGQQGNGSTQVNKKPALVHGLDGHKITKVACGSSHSMAWCTTDVMQTSSYEPVPFSSSSDALGTSFVVKHITEECGQPNAKHSGQLFNETSQPSSNLPQVVLSLPSKADKILAFHNLLRGLQIMYARKAIIESLKTSSSSIPASSSSASSSSLSLFVEEPEEPNKMNGREEDTIDRTSLPTGVPEVNGCYTESMNTQGKLNKIQMRQSSNLACHLSHSFKFDELIEGGDCLDGRISSGINEHIYSIVSLSCPDFSNVVGSICHDVAPVQDASKTISSACAISKTCTILSTGTITSTCTIPSTLHWDGHCSEEVNKQPIKDDVCGDEHTRIDFKENLEENCIKDSKSISFHDTGNHSSNSCFVNKNDASDDEVVDEIVDGARLLNNNDRAEDIVTKESTTPETESLMSEEHKLSLNNLDLDEFTRDVTVDDARNIIDLMKLACANRVSSDAQVVLSHLLYNLTRYNPQIAEMLLEMCVTELEDVSVDLTTLPSSDVTARRWTSNDQHLRPMVQESEHPYREDTCYRSSGSFRIPGASSLRLEFDDRCATEKNVDVLHIYDAQHRSLATKSGCSRSDWSSNVIIPGDTVRWWFLVRGSYIGWGWKFTAHPIASPPSSSFLMACDYASDRMLLSRPSINLVALLLDLKLPMNNNNHNIVLRLAANLASCSQISSIGTYQKIWILKKLRTLMLSHFGRDINISSLVSNSPSDWPENSSLVKLVKNLPEMLLKQYEYEEPIVRNGKQLFFSRFFKELVSLACDLGLDSFMNICSQSHQKWQWFHKYCLTSRVAFSIQERTQLPLEFCEEVMRKVRKMSSDDDDLIDRSHESHALFTRDLDEQLLLWLNRNPEDWTLTNNGTGQIYVWGHNHRGQLGGVEGTKIKTPVVCEALSLLRPTQVVGGEQSLFVLTTDGKVYTCGYGAAGRLGLGGTETVLSLMLIESIQHIHIKKVSVNSGGRHCLALTSDGEVFSWGEGEDGKLGHGTKSSGSRPRIIESLRGKEVIEVAAGGAHSACIVLGGQLYTWGKGRYGRLGHGDGEDQLKPKLVELLRDYIVVDVACGSGDAQTLCITSDSSVWSWGDGDYGKLGRGGSEGCKVPLVIPSLQGLGVVKVDCGSQFSVALTRAGSVYTWGKGDYHRLGHGSEEHVRRPKRLLSLQGKKVVTIACGSLHCVCCTDAGEVYTWGDNDEGQLGDGTLNPMTKPGLVSNLQDKKINKLSCGSAHSIAWSTNKSNYSHKLPLHVPVEYNLLQPMEPRIFRNRLILLHHFSEIFCPIIPMMDLDGNHHHHHHHHHHYHNLADMIKDFDAHDDCSLRKFIISSAKESFFKKVIQSTMMRERLHGPVIEINRIQVKRSRNKGGLAGVDGMKSVFGQVCGRMDELVGDVLMMPHRIWKVKLIGEGVDDCGGGYSESIVEMCEELQNGSVPLLIQTPNGRDDCGSNRDCFILNPHLHSPTHQNMFKFLGMLMGIAIRTGSPLDLSLAEPVWKQLVGLNLSVADLNEMDKHFIPGLIHIRNMDDASLKTAGLPFTTTSSAGREVKLKSKYVKVDGTNKYEYIKAALSYRLHEFDEQMDEIRTGMSRVVPVPLLNLFTGTQLEAMVCGSPDIPLPLLKSVASYKGIEPTSNLIKWFWEVMEEFTNMERSLFLRFVWGRTRLPRTIADFRGRDFVIQVLERYDPPDNFLPESYTCFFLLKMPWYTSKDVLRDKLRYAIYFCKSIDIDDYARIALTSSHMDTDSSNDVDDNEECSALGPDFTDLTSDNDELAG